MTRMTKWLPALALAVISASAAAADKPNILVIFADDIGQTNISAYSMGVIEEKSKAPAKP